MSRYTTRADVACPRCRAEPGEECVTTGGNPTVIHLARLDARDKLRLVPEPPTELPVRENRMTERAKLILRAARGACTGADPARSVLTAVLRQMRESSSTVTSHGLTWSPDMLVHLLRELDALGSTPEQIPPGRYAYTLDVPTFVRWPPLAEDAHWHVLGTAEQVIPGAEVVVYRHSDNDYPYVLIGDIVAERMVRKRGSEDKIRFVIAEFSKVDYLEDQ